MENCDLEPMTEDKVISSRMVPCSEHRVRSFEIMMVYECHGRSRFSERIQHEHQGPSRSLPTEARIGS